MLQLANLGLQNAWAKRTPIKPTALSANVWIDAEDYAVGTFSNGAVITNKANGAITFAVVGTTLSIQINSDGKKEFVFDGASTIRCTSASSDFAKYKNGTTSSTILFLGKFGTASNPDAFYGVCGNSSGSSLAHGIYVGIENRVAQPATKGIQYAVSRNVINSLPINSRWDNAVFNTRVSTYVHTDLNLIMDNTRLFQQGDLVAVTDRIRTTANTTSGLGTVIPFSGTNPTHDFEIGAMGNGAGKLTGKMEQFVIFDLQLTMTQVRGVDSYFQIQTTTGDTNFKYITHVQTLTDDYLLGGVYGANAAKNKTNVITSRGPDHFGAGQDRAVVESISVNNGYTFPSFTEFFADASTSPQGALAGGYLPSGRLVICYGKYTTATGVYTTLIVRYSDDDGATWSSEYLVSIPVTSPTLTGWNVLDKIESCDNGDLVVTWYGASGTSLYNLYEMKSTDNAATWTNTLIATSPTVYRNEGSIVDLGGGNRLSMFRVEVAVSGSFVYQQYFSNDNGATWADQGQTSFGLTLYVYAHPIILRRINIDGTRVIVAYFVNRGSRRFHCVYATAADLIANGLSAWTGKSVYTLDIRLYGADLGWEVGYPRVEHLDNDLKCEGIYSAETVNNDVSTLTVFKMGDDWKAKIKSELGI